MLKLWSGFGPTCWAARWACARRRADAASLASLLRPRGYLSDYGSGLHPWLLLLTDRVVRRPSLSPAGLARSSPPFPHLPFDRLPLLWPRRFAARAWACAREGAAGPRRSVLRLAVAGGRRWRRSAWSRCRARVLSATCASAPGIHRPTLPPGRAAIFLPDYCCRPTIPRAAPLLRALLLGGAARCSAPRAAVARPSARRRGAFGGLLAVVRGPAVVQGRDPAPSQLVPQHPPGRPERLRARAAGAGGDDLTSRERTGGPRGRRVCGGRIAAGRGRDAVAAAARRPRRAALCVLDACSRRPAGSTATSAARRDRAVLAGCLSTSPRAGVLLLRLGGRVGGRVRALPWRAFATCSAPVLAQPCDRPHVRRASRPGAIRFRSAAAAPSPAGLAPPERHPVDFRIDDARGYDLPTWRLYDRLFAAAISPRHVGAQCFLDIPCAASHSARAAHLRLLGVRTPGATSVLPAPAVDRLVPYPPYRRPGPHAGLRRRDARVYGSPAPCPALGRGASAWSAADDAALAAVTGAG